MDGISALSSPVIAVVLDWAGTTVDFGCMAPVDALLRVFNADGVDITPAEARADMGRAKLDHLRAILSAPAVVARWKVAKGGVPDEADVARLYAALEPEMVAAAGRAASLIPGAAATVAALRSQGIRIGSGTGYTRQMMEPVIAAARDQGYEPDVVICAGETPSGRPSPLMTWAALIALDAYPAEACIKVDDAPVGILEGRCAGCWTVGLAASGNGVGLPLAEYSALTESEKLKRSAVAATALQEAGADYVIDTIAELNVIVERIAARIAAGERPGSKA